MKLFNTTPDGSFTLTISSVFEDEDEDVPDASMLQLVQLLERTAQTLRLCVDPPLPPAPPPPPPPERDPAG